MVRCNYNICTVTVDDYVGGLVSGNDGSITNSCNNCAVTGIENVRGLVGENYGRITMSFWDIETSGHIRSYGGTGKTTAEI